MLKFILDRFHHWMAYRPERHYMRGRG